MNQNARWNSERIKNFLSLSVRLIVTSNDVVVSIVFLIFCWWHIRIHNLEGTFRAQGLFKSFRASQFGTECVRHIWVFGFSLILCPNGGYIERGLSDFITFGNMKNKKHLHAYCPLVEVVRHLHVSRTLEVVRHLHVSRTLEVVRHLHMSRTLEVVDIYMCREL